LKGRRQTSPRSRSFLSAAIVPKTTFATTSQRLARRRVRRNACETLARHCPRADSARSCLGDPTRTPLQAFCKRFSGHERAQMSDRQGADARRDAIPGQFVCFRCPGAGALDQVIQVRILEGQLTARDPLHRSNDLQCPGPDQEESRETDHQRRLVGHAFHGDSERRQRNHRQVHHSRDHQ